MQQIIMFERAAAGVRGFVLNQTDAGLRTIEDICEGPTVSEVCAHLLSHNTGVSAVLAPSGELDSGDALSLGEVAALLYAEL